MELKGTRTEKNLLTAFAGESQARNRYTYFAEKAAEEGYIQIAQIFEETASQEKEHAKRIFKLLKGGSVEIQAEFPAGAIGTTAENLRAGAAGVHFEDQLAAEKKCGHMGGKVLVPTSQHVRNLISARLAADVMGVPTIVLARTR